MKRIKLYAGYHELIITDKALPRPYVLLSRHNGMEQAERAAQRYDSEAYVCYDEDIVHLCGWYAGDEELSNVFSYKEDAA